MKVQMLLVFAGGWKYGDIVTGSVIREVNDTYLVDFSFQGTEFRGYWPKNKCMIVK